MSNITNRPLGVLDKAARWLSGNGPAPAAGVGNPKGGEISRLSGVVENAAMRSDRAKRCHDDARRQIDAALYELDQLRQEIAGIVDPKLITARDAPPPLVAAPAIRDDAPAMAEVETVTAGLERSKRSAA